MALVPNFDQINEDNRRFWEEQNTLNERRVSDAMVRETAFARLFNEQARGVPVRSQATIEQLLADVEEENRRFLSRQARKAGQAKKPDALHQAISDLVRRDPQITLAKVRAMLTRERSPGLIEDVEEETIWFVQPDGSEEGRPKKAPISGLKHRLSRAKKAHKSR